MDSDPLKLSDEQALNSGFFHWIVERHEVYRKRAAGLPFEKWTDDEILKRYKFTNPFRENDSETMWMRVYLKPDDPVDATLTNNIMNAALFRMIGTRHFAEVFLREHGWITPHNYNQDMLISIIDDLLERKQKCFTGAYIITNQGIKARKSKVVIGSFITGLYCQVYHEPNVRKLATFTRQQQFQEWLMKFRGFGGGGFMAYEVVCDITHMPLMHGSPPRSWLVDRYTWGNAGPGALRGLNRVWGKPLTSGFGAPATSLRKMQVLHDMKELLHDISKEYGYRPIDLFDVDMRCIEHSLCEYDKYMRVKNDEGRPRSVAKYKQGVGYPIQRGPVL